MSLRGFWWGACLLVLGGCSVPSLVELMGERILPLSVSYSNSFTKGCLQLVARGVGSQGVQTEITLEDLSRQSSPWRPTLLRRTEWTGDVEVSLRAREQDCRGKVVEEQQVTFAAGDAQERRVALAIVDEDGDGYIASSRGGSDCDDLDSERSPARAEICDDKDNNCNGATDEDFDKTWYLDEDGDGVPRGPDFIVACAAPSAKHVHQAEGQTFDCKDTGVDAEKMFPGNPELCDNIDNDCDNIVDNGFEPRGVTCNAECQGVTVCSGDGTAVVCSQEPGRYYYLDRDGDGQGAKGSARILKCGREQADPGTVPNDYDCDDADVAARAGLTEVCDAIDNDCDGAVDNPVQACGGTLKNVESYFVNLPNHHWKTVSVGANGHVWAAGDGGKLVLRRQGEQKFESFSYYSSAPVPPSDGSLVLNDNNCGNVNWTSSWVNANGVVFLGGDGGAVAIHPGARGTAAYDCVPGAVPGQSRITGMIGFEGEVGPTIYLVDSSARLYRWRPSLPVAERFTELNNGVFAYYGVHALAPEFVLAVGGTTQAPVQRFYSHNVQQQSQTAASNEHTSNPNNLSGGARAVWMGSASSACAVGDYAAVWRWDGAMTWHKVDGPAGASGTFTSVVMRNDNQSLLTGQCYIVGGDGSSQSKVHRLTQYGWARPLDLPAATANVPLNDLAITATGELWIVGQNGRVFHYPEP